MRSIFIHCIFLCSKLKESDGDRSLRRALITHRYTAIEHIFYEEKLFVFV